MALIAQPFRHPDSGIYYLRRRVPDDLRHIIGKTEIRRSLNTQNHQQAKSAFAVAYVESEQLFHDAPPWTLRSTTPDGGTDAPPSSSFAAEGKRKTSTPFKNTYWLRQGHINVG